MNRQSSIKLWISTAFILLAVVFFAGSLFSGLGRSDLDGAASDMGRKVAQRMKILDSYIQKAVRGDADKWMDLQGLPDDMVVYRYVDDTLQCWANQFPIGNDDIRPFTLVQRLGDSRNNLVSPLLDVGTQPSFINHGPKWFIEKKVEENGMVIIAGLEIVNEMQAGPLNGINRHFRVDERFTVRPLSSGVGAAVSLDGIPLFKLTCETVSEPSARHSILLFFASHSL